MRSLTIDNIGMLVTNDPARSEGSPATAGAPADEGRLGLVHRAAVVVEDGRIQWIGAAGRAPATDDRHDAGGAAVIPGFVDSHAHLVFAGDRAEEFSARMSGQPYSAGGIRSTVAATRAASDEELTANATRLLAEMRRQGTTTTEIKTGYGLTVRDEERAARIAATLTSEVTFLGGHVVPPEFAEDTDGYVALVTGSMLEACATSARWIDVFCERGAFSVDASRAILRAGSERGLLPRVHANQLGHGPGIQLACEVGAASADHCTYASDEDLGAMADAGVVATLLPAVEFSTRSPYPDARRFARAGVQVALASDCNPGSCFSTSMPFCIALAVREMRMTPAEALLAATAGGAAALHRDDVGHLAVGAAADLVVLDAPSYVHLAYRPGVPLVRETFVGGRRVA